jgi:hypothetical protein
MTFSFVFLWRVYRLPVGHLLIIKQIFKTISYEGTFRQHFPIEGTIGAQYTLYTLYTFITDSRTKHLHNILDKLHLVQQNFNFNVLTPEFYI